MENMLETKDYRAIPSVLCLCAHGTTGTQTRWACSVLGTDGCLPDSGDLQVCPTEGLASHQDHNRMCPLC